MKERVQRGLEQHGYGFQYSALRECLRLRDEQRSAWDLLVTEYPISVGGSDVRIDFILRSEADKADRKEIRYLIVECKRVNPAYSDWCFSAVPYTRPKWLAAQVVFETVRPTDRVTGGFGGNCDGRICGVAFVLKGDAKGDKHPVSPGKDAIEAACTQVLRGLNGFVKICAGREEAPREGQAIHSFLPVILTTANLWIAACNLASADLETGSIPHLSAAEVDFLFYQYPQSVSLKHDLERGRISSDTLVEEYARDYIRTVAIVSPRGLAPFLGEDWFRAPLEGR
jgi:hypothetical protein